MSKIWRANEWLIQGTDFRAKYVLASKQQQLDITQMRDPQLREKLDSGLK